MCEGCTAKRSERRALPVIAGVMAGCFAGLAYGVALELGDDIVALGKRVAGRMRRRIFEDLRTAVKEEVGRSASAAKEG